MSLAVLKEFCKEPIRTTPNLLSFLHTILHDSNSIDYKTKHFSEHKNVLMIIHIWEANNEACKFVEGCLQSKR